MKLEKWKKKQLYQTILDDIFCFLLIWPKFPFGSNTAILVSHKWHSQGVLIFLNFYKFKFQLFGNLFGFLYIYNGGHNILRLLSRYFTNLLFHCNWNETKMFAEVTSRLAGRLETWDLKKFRKFRKILKMLEIIVDCSIFLPK